MFIVKIPVTKETFSIKKGRISDNFASKNFHPVSKMITTEAGIITTGRHIILGNEQDDIEVKVYLNL